jgi:hypothetical protein
VRDADVDDPPCPQLGDDEREERPEPDIGNLHEIAGPDLADVVAQERRPGLPIMRRRARLVHVALDRALRDRDPEFEQLAPDAVSAPQPVVGGHLLDEGNRLCRDPWFLRCRVGFRFPEQAQARALPAQGGLRSDDEQRFPLVLHLPREHDNKRAIGARAARSFARAVKHEELLAQQQVFGDQLRFAARQIGDRADQRDRRERLAPARDDLPKGLDSAQGQRAKMILEETEHQHGLLHEWEVSIQAAMMGPLPIVPMC